MKQELTEIKYVREPDDLQCGQAVLAMVTGIDVKAVAAELQNERETNFKEMKTFLGKYGYLISGERKQAFYKKELPPFCLLSLETPRCWHWSLYRDGVFYDPEHGVALDFPRSNRKYYWEIKNIED